MWNFLTRSFIYLSALTTTCWEIVYQFRNREISFCLLNLTVVFIRIYWFLTIWIFRMHNPPANFAHGRFPIAIREYLLVSPIQSSLRSRVAIHNYHLRDTVLVLKCEILASPRNALIAHFSHSSRFPPHVPSICIVVCSIKSFDLSYKIETTATRPPFPLSLFPP